MNPAGVSLDVLIDGFAEPKSNVVVTNLSLRADQVEDSGLFLACQGACSHGLDYVEQAIQKGASAVLWEPASGRDFSHPDIVQQPIPNLSERVSTIADRFFNQPSEQIRLAGVTGTNGKTSTVKLIADGLERLSLPCGVLGTLGYGRPATMVSSDLTTPDAVTIQRILAEFRDSNLEFAAMEVSSHGLAQHRVQGIRYNVAVFTNLSRDHLDYHKDMDDYASAKAELFKFPNLSAAVVNLADPRGQEFWSAAAGADKRIGIWVGERAQHDVEHFICAEELTAHTSGLEIHIDSSWGRGVLSSSLLGSFNGLNLLSAAAVLLHWGVPFEQVLSSLSQSQPVPGRMESVAEPEQPLVVVDYSHTPDSLEKALSALSSHCVGELIVVFGCGGDRDPGKRPMMGEVASRLADRIYVTDDNPRSESSKTISDAILKGIANDAPVVVEHDRAAAIKQAITYASKKDVVLIAGKGHENYQVRQSERIHFDDREQARQVLSQISGGVA
ncbi:MAG: UDP-N-acetylmuramoyl-L-alanyl-D-glutamate--2,6-diaminopimelate ligase [Pseudomonadota bacterium]